MSYLTCAGVVSGYADGTFRPYATTTRSQAVKLAVLAFGPAAATPGAGGYTFADVPPAHPFFAVVEAAARAGLVSGHTCGAPGEPCDAQQRPYFRPYAAVTRGQVAKIVALAAGWALQDPASATFADVPAGSPFYRYVETAYCHAALAGYGCGGPGEPCDPQQRPYFRPAQTGLRAQLATIVYGALHSGPGCTLPLR